MGLQVLRLTLVVGGVGILAPTGSMTGRDRKRENPSLVMVVENRATLGPTAQIKLGG